VGLGCAIGLGRLTIQLIHFGERLKEDRIISSRAFVPCKI
jgi:hypothetical protein